MALSKLESAGINILTTSKIYITEAHAYIQQPDYFNAVAAARSSLPPEALLQVLKRIEAQAGRKPHSHHSEPYFHWAPRPLDLDIVSYKGRVCNWRSTTPQRRFRVILPHPRAHERAFVLAPLTEIAPFWHHPVFGLTASELLKRPKVRRTGKVKGILSFNGFPSKTLP